MSVEQSMQRIRETGRRLSNWGRWGKEDQRGTMNFLTPDAVRHAASLVKTGRTIRLGFKFANRVVDQCQVNVPVP